MLRTDKTSNKQSHTVPVEHTHHKAKKESTQNQLNSGPARKGRLAAQVEAAHLKRKHSSHKTHKEQQGTAQGHMATGVTAKER